MGVDASNRYNRGDYVGAKRVVTAAVAMARKHDSSRILDSFSKLSAQLAEVEGNYDEARDQYIASIKFRRFLKRPPWPELHETLGSLETRLGYYESARANLLIALEGYKLSKETKGTAAVSTARWGSFSSRKVTCHPQGATLSRAWRC